jgi:DNA primase
MKDAKDPDEFLKKFGADRFKLLLEDASNRVEYQLNAIRRKYDLREDEQRIKFVQECAELIGTLSSSAQRYVYGNRIAEEAKITHQAMELEINKSHKRRERRKKREEEKRILEAARNVQPKSRSIRYDDVKSARAEETIIAMAMKDPALLDQTDGLKASEFSVPLFANVYGQMLSRHREGLGISVAGLTELSGDEASHIAMVTQQLTGPVNETAFRDCVSLIRERHKQKNVSSDDDLMAFRKRKKENGGYGG